MMRKLILKEHRVMRARSFAQRYKAVRHAALVCAFTFSAMVWLYGQNQDSLRIDDKGVTINGELILQNGWRIYSTGPYSLRFDRGSDAVMAIGGYLEYKFPGVPYFYQLIKDPFEENSNRAYWNSKSDSRLKTDVSIIPSALAKVNKLNGIT